MNFFLTIIFLFSLGYPAQAAAPCQGACILAAKTLEKQSGLPPHLLISVLMAESTPKGWPWALNVKGKSYYFSTKKQAVAMVRKLQKSGITNIDVGCMQINLRYHGHAFKTIEDSLDPQCNVSYGAAFLRTLQQRYRSWAAAVAYYHSTCPKAQRTYLERVMRYWKSLYQRRVVQLPRVTHPGSAYHAVWIPQKAVPKALPRVKTVRQGKKGKN